MSDENINEYLVKFNGKLSITEPLDIDHSYRIGLDVEISEGTKQSNQNGTFNIIYKGQVIGGEVAKSNGDILLAKDNNSNSSKLRKQIFALGEDYDEIHNLIRAHLSEIIKQYK